MSEELIARVRKAIEFGKSNPWVHYRGHDVLELLQLLVDALDSSYEAMKVVCIDPYEGRELCLKLVNRRAETEG